MNGNVLCTFPHGMHAAMSPMANSSHLKCYAWGVYQELQTAFKGLLPEMENHEMIEPQGN